MRTLVGAIVSCVLVIPWTGCAKDLYQQRTVLIKDHIRNFYDHLQSDRVRSAIFENERLEALASTIGAEIRQSPQSFADNQVNRDWVLLKTANQAAAENWLHLGRYLTHRNRYDEALGAYQRVLSTYRDEQYQAYREQAKAGLQDIETILVPSPRP